MAFLDNSGDIILDAVLTDTGRKRLARGDGSFNVAKFALGDDEINYGLYDKNHASGSAYYDINILQTPVLEAFTNNTSTMKSKLITISRTNLLYLPEIKLNTSTVNGQGGARNESYTPGLHLVAVDSDSVTALNGVSSYTFLNGKEPNNSQSDSKIVFDQGLDTLELSPLQAIDADLRETQYIVHIDNRLGSIASADSTTIANYSFLDDDNIATYYFSEGGSTGNNAGFISEPTAHTQGDSPSQTSVIDGPRGTRFSFRIKASIELESSTFLFEQLGPDAATLTGAGSAGNFRHLDTIIKVMGATTGYSVEIPVRFVKKVS